MKNEIVTTFDLKVFLIILFAVSFIFFFAMTIGLMIEKDNTAFLTEKVQDQFWEIQDLKQEVAYCDYRRGVEQSIVLDSVVVPKR